MTVTDAIFHGLFVAMHHATTSLICFTVTVFVRFIVPLIAPNATVYWLLLGVTCAIVYSVLFNYAFCVWTDPGKIKVRPREDEYEFNNDSDEEADFMAPMALETLPPTHAKEKTTYCRRCQLQRPRRAHHCSICQVCVDHMDHHCPWINNCVGLHNHRYFCSFLFWLALGCWYCAVLSFWPAVGNVSREELAKFANVFSSEMLALGPKAMMYCVFLIATSSGILVSCLGSWHFYLVLTAQTSIEYQINRSKRTLRTTGGKILSPYCCGSSHKNWEAVFGPCRWKIVSLLPSRRPIPLYALAEGSEKDVV
ncbi:palmitoyltransferase [Achlya hypogyna]|uniref:Palmitoyltransferase n=1 Tax=Achlya hypogyna TaxID=1202772 RepID=A0A1V9ZKU5_ACHHY|nr:palmitoyltransferase [Achlya hypogyna]